MNKLRDTIIKSEIDLICKTYLRLNLKESSQSIETFKYLLFEENLFKTICNEEKEKFLKSLSTKFWKECDKSDNKFEITDEKFVSNYNR